MILNWIKRNFVKIQVIAIVLSIVSFAFYGIHIRQYNIYKQYEGMRGKVTSVFHARSCNLINVQLDSGLSGSVNVGYRDYNVGDIYINHVEYDRILGLGGRAYFIAPDGVRGFLEFMVMFIIYIIIVLIVIGIICEYLVYLFKNWK